MELEQTDFDPFLSLSPGLVGAIESAEDDPVYFVHHEMRPTPEARETISFGSGFLDDDVLSTAASDSDSELAGDISSFLPPNTRKTSFPFVQQTSGNCFPCGL
ncbi:MAG: hypothetical protein ACRDAX_00155 [Propionibacteriaceae bacterium]